MDSSREVEPERRIFAGIGAARYLARGERRRAERRQRHFRLLRRRRARRGRGRRRASPPRSSAAGTCSARPRSPPGTWAGGREIQDEELQRLRVGRGHPDIVPCLAPDSSTRLSRRRSVSASRRATRSSSGPASPRRPPPASSPTTRSRVLSPRGLEQMAHRAGNRAGHARSVSSAPARGSRPRAATRPRPATRRTSVKPAPALSGPSSSAWTPRRCPATPAGWARSPRYRRRRRASGRIRTSCSKRGTPRCRCSGPNLGERAERLRELRLREWLREEADREREALDAVAADRGEAGGEEDAAGSGPRASARRRARSRPSTASRCR